jgi:hypothetical protein
VTHYRGNFNEDKSLLGTQEIINAGLGERQEFNVKSSGFLEESNTREMFNMTIAV